MPLHSKFFSLLALCVSLAACQESPDDGLLPEVSCSEAGGLWTQVRVSCDGEEQSSLSPVTYNFSNSSQLEQTQGADQCESIFDWSYSVGTSTPTMELIGENNVRCSSEGSSVSSCNAQGNSCNDATDFSGVANGFSLCVIQGEEMTLRRTVSVLNNPDGLSYCTSGQDEVIVLRKGEHDPTDQETGSGDNTPRARLEVQQANPFNFGTVALGVRRSRQLKVTNLGQEVASELHGVRPQAPFSYRGGRFPGERGSCESTLSPNESCVLSLEFFPQQEGTHAGLLSLVFFDGRRQQTQAHNLVGVGTRKLASLALSDGPFFSFEPVLVGEVTNHRFELINAGGGPAQGIQALNLASPFDFTGGLFPGLAGSCRGDLEVGEICTIDVEFRPQEPGAFNGRLEIQYSDGANSRQLQRNLFGTARPLTP